MATCRRADATWNKTCNEVRELSKVSNSSCRALIALLFEFATSRKILTKRVPMLVTLKMLTRAALVLAVVTVGAKSYAASQIEQMAFGSSLRLNFAQGMKLASQSDRSCPHENKRLNSVRDLRISVYYGYWNIEKLVSDGAQAAAFAAALRAPCPENLEACGFKLQSQSRFRTVVVKKVGVRNITISIHSTSVSGDAAANKNPSLAGQAQEQRSNIVEQEFNQSLVTDDVVFYSGHARYGGGLGFRVDSIVSDALNIAFRGPIRPMANALRARPSRLKLLGLFTCESDRHYRYVVEDTNPHANLIVTHGDILNVEGDQTMLGALNSILMNKCSAEFQDSLVSTVAPHSKILEYVRRPE
jgi:hypothetical protein